MTGVLDADQASISDLSLRLMEHIVRERDVAASGETQLVRRGLAMPDSLIDWLICVALDAQSWTNSMELNRDLIVLIRERLGGSNQRYKQAVEAHTKQRHAQWIGAQLKARGIEPTVRRIAEVLEVAPSTVTRWYPNNAELQEKIDRLSGLFDSAGSFQTSRLAAKKERCASHCSAGRSMRLPGPYGTSCSAAARRPARTMMRNSPCAGDPNSNPGRGVGAR